MDRQICNVRLRSGQTFFGVIEIGTHPSYFTLLVESKRETKRYLIPFNAVEWIEIHDS